jgi:PAS domain S-box-containing protein
MNRHPSSPEPKAVPNRLFLIFILLAVGIGLSGYLFFNNQKSHLKNEFENELSAIADLKVDQLVRWRDERMRDAKVIFHNPLVYERMNGFIRSAQDPEIRNKIVAWMSILQKYMFYKRVLFFDKSGELLVEVGEHRGPAESHERAFTIEAMREGKLIFTDFLDGAGGDIHLDIIIPVLSSESGTGQKSIGEFLLEIDPFIYLYPLIQSWPTSSLTGETLLIRREGDEILFLNELRHRKDTALSMRRSVSEESLPAAVAVRGHQGIVDGHDYRGVKVLSAVRAIPDSPWFLVAKIDSEEVYAPILERAGYIGLIVGLFILAAGISSVLWWRQQSAVHYRRQYEAELQHHSLLQRYEYLSRYANDIILQIDLDGNIIEANERAAASYGYTRNEMLKLHIRDIRAPEARGNILEQMKEVREHNGLVFETVHLRKDGSTFPAEVSSRVIDVEGRKIYLSIIRDISERKEAERKVAHATRLYAVLSQINQSIVRIDDRDRLFEDICRIAVEHGGFRMAWVGLIDKEQKIVKPAAHCGYEEGYLEKIAVSISEDIPEGWGPSGRAIREGRHVVCNRIETDPCMMPWHEEALKRGYRSSGTFPLRVRGEVVGVLKIYSEEEGFFDDEEVHLLEEVADDISFALEALERDAQRKALEDDLIRSEKRYRELFNYISNGVVVYEAAYGGEDFIVRDFNRAGEEIEKIKKEELVGKKLTDAFPGVREFGLFDVIRRVWKTGIPEHFPTKLYKDSRIQGWRENYVYKLPTGEVVAVYEDVTERRRAEEEITLFKDLMDRSNDSIFVVDAATARFLYVNDTACSSLRYGREELLNMRVTDVEEHLPGSADWKNADELKKKGHAVFDTVLRRKDGTVYPAEVNIKFVTQHNRDYMVSIARDVTEKRRLEEQLRQAQKMEAVGQLAGGVAHDFNNILSAIIGYGHVLFEKMEEADPLRVNVEQILEAAEKAADVTHSLLAFSRKQIFNLKPVDINEVIRKMERFLSRVIGEDVELKTLLHEAQLPVLADNGQMEQVLMNLAMNARDAMPRGGSLTITAGRFVLDDAFVAAHGYGERGGYALISVNDTGKGMDEETRSRIFEPFFTTKEMGKGTGLGLAMVYGIIKQHGGYINVYSEPGRGATFRIYLPLSSGAIEQGQETPEVTATSAGGTETILVAEDDAAIRRLLEIVLREYGYSVVMAADGEEAVKKFMENRDRIDLLLFDMIMPKKNGREAYEEIRKIRPEIKTIFASGYTADVVHKEGVLAEGAEFLLKPISPKDLVRKVRETLDK